MGEFPALQPVLQKASGIASPGRGPERLATVIEELREEDHRFHMEGGSWTNNISWVRGYDNVLGPMEGASSPFHEKIHARGHRRATRAIAMHCFIC